MLTDGQNLDLGVNKNTTDDGFFDFYYNPIFQIISAFVIGFLFAPLSIGFFIFIMFYLLSELFFAIKFGFKYTQDTVILRFSVFLYGVFGFVLGRMLVGDYDPCRHHYDEWDL